MGKLRTANNRRNRAIRHTVARALVATEKTAGASATAKAVTKPVKAAS